MTLQIATRAEPAYRQRVRLDGTSWTLAIRWNDRGAFWVLDILDALEVLAVAGIQIRVGSPLNDPHTGAGPPGVLFAVDSSGKGQDPGFADLGAGARVQLLYLEAAEIAALG